jgi:hypothetical protein
MSRRFVIEAVMIAIYGQLLQPKRAVEYRIPYSTVMELYDLRESEEPIMQNPVDERHVREKISEMIAFFEAPLNKKKLERALISPWKESPPMPVNEHVTLIVVNAIENMQYGELFDPIETEIILTSLRLQIPVLTDHVEFQEKAVQHEVPIQLYDIDDFEFALEEADKLTDGFSNFE